MSICSFLFVWVNCCLLCVAYLDFRQYVLIGWFCRLLSMMAVGWCLEVPNGFWCEGFSCDFFMALRCFAFYEHLEFGFDKRFFWDEKCTSNLYAKIWWIYRLTYCKFLFMKSKMYMQIAIWFGETFLIIRHAFKMCYDITTSTKLYVYRVDIKQQGKSNTNINSPVTTMLSTTTKKSVWINYSFKV